MRLTGTISLPSRTKRDFCHTGVVTGAGHCPNLQEFPCLDTHNRKTRFQGGHPSSTIASTGGWQLRERRRLRYWSCMPEAWKREALRSALAYRKTTSENWPADTVFAKADVRLARNLNRQRQLHQFATATSRHINWRGAASLCHLISNWNTRGCWLTVAAGVGPLRNWGFFRLVAAEAPWLHSIAGSERVLRDFEPVKLAVRVAETFEASVVLRLCFPQAAVSTRIVHPGHFDGEMRST